MPDGRDAAAPEAGSDAATRVVLAAVRELVAELRPGVDVAVGRETRFVSDLGFDSLTVAELVVRVEAAAGCRVPDAAIADVDSVAALADVVARVDRADNIVHSAGDVSAATRHVADPRTREQRSRSDGDHRLSGAGGMAALTGRRRLVGVATMVLFALVAAVAWPLVMVLPGATRRWWVVRCAGRLLFALTGTRLQVRGAHHLPRHGGYVAVANHASFLDPLVVAMVLPPPVVFAAIAGLAERRAVRLFLHRLGAVLVAPPSERGQALRDAARLRELAGRGHRLALFPEGRRTTTVGLEPFRMGAFVAAADAGVPVVPITIRGTRSVLPVDARWPRRAPIDVLVAPPVTATSTGWGGAIELQRAARHAILRTCGEPDLLAPPSPAG